MTTRPPRREPIGPILSAPVRQVETALPHGCRLIVPARIGLADRIGFPRPSCRAKAAGRHSTRADEPTGNLERTSAVQVMALIAEINRDEGTTFLISTPDEKIAATCRRRISMRDGVLVQ